MRKRCFALVLLGYLALYTVGCGYVSKEEHDVLNVKCKEYEAQIEKLEEQIKEYESQDWYEDGKLLISQQIEEVKAEMEKNYKQVTVYIEQNVEETEQQKVMQRVNELYEFYCSVSESHSATFFEICEKMCEGYNNEDDISKEKLETLLDVCEKVETSCWAFHVHVLEICPGYEWSY